MSAAIAAQSEANPAKVRMTNITLTANEKAMFCRMMLSVRREW